MRVHGEMAFHALCGDEAVLAFDLCARAFAFALRAELVDVAKGYVNDCALIGENHVMPAALAPVAQVALMRAEASLRTDDYAAAAESLDTVADAVFYRPRCGDAARAWRARARQGVSHDARHAATPYVVVAFAGARVEFPTSNDVLLAIHAGAARGPADGLWGLGRAAFELTRQLKKSTRRIDAEKRKLRRLVGAWGKASV